MGIPHAEQADLEKVRLEAKQRQERTAAEAAGKPWQSRWFQKVPTPLPAPAPAAAALVCTGPHTCGLATGQQAVWCMRRSPSACMGMVLGFGVYGSEVKGCHW